MLKSLLLLGLGNAGISWLVIGFTASIFMILFYRFKNVSKSIKIFQTASNTFAFYHLKIYLFKKIFFLCCWARWGYIVTFTKVLTMYQIYLISTPQWLAFILPPPIPGVVSIGYHFCIYTHVYTVLHVIHSPTPLCHFLPSTETPAPRTCSALLFSDLVEEKRKSWYCLAWATQEVPYVIFTYMCIITPIGLSPLIFFILL
jgi:hypothetical protein